MLDSLTYKYFFKSIWAHTQLAMGKDFISYFGNVGSATKKNEGTNT